MLRSAAFMCLCITGFQCQLLDSWMDASLLFLLSGLDLYAYSLIKCLKLSVLLKSPVKMRKRKPVEY